MNIETQIRNIIEENMKCKYIGKIKVETEDLPGGTLRTLFMYLDTEHSPIIMGMQGTEEEFLAFITKEIRTRTLKYVSFYKTILEQADSDYE